MTELSESEQARQLAAHVRDLADQFTAEAPATAQEAVEYLTLMHTKLLEFADNPDDPRLRGEVEMHVENFVALTAQAQNATQ